MVPKEAIRRNFVVLLLAYVVVSGCSIADGGSFTISLDLPGENTSQCARLIETRNNFVRTSDVFTKSFEDIFVNFGEKANPIEYYLSIGWDKNNFIHQSDSKTCWAATLAMAFRHGGFHYKQSAFIDKLNEVCGSGFGTDATSNQIIFALTAVHTDTSIWPADATGARRAWYKKDLITRLVSGPAPGSSSTLVDIEWSRGSGASFRKGGLFPIYAESQLITNIMNRTPIVVGYSYGENLHVGLIVGIRVSSLHISNKLTESAIIPLISRIDSIDIVDPQGNGSISTYPIDYLYKNIRFIFALKA